MKELKAWHEDDGFWQKVSPIVFGEKCWQSTAPQIDQVTVLLGLKPPMTILDLCCGLGRHSMELARRGFQVTGVDRTAVYLEKAEETGQRGETADRIYPGGHAQVLPPGHVRCRSEFLHVVWLL